MVVVGTEGAALVPARLASLPLDSLTRYVALDLHSQETIADLRASDGPITVQRLRATILDEPRDILYYLYYETEESDPVVSDSTVIPRPRVVDPFVRARLAKYCTEATAKRVGKPGIQVTPSTAPELTPAPAQERREDKPRDVKGTSSHRTLGLIETGGKVLVGTTSPTTGKPVDAPMRPPSHVPGAPPGQASRLRHL